MSDLHNTPDTFDPEAIADKVALRQHDALLARRCGHLVIDSDVNQELLAVLDRLLDSRMPAKGIGFPSEDLFTDVIEVYAAQKPRDGDEPVVSRYELSDAACVRRLRGQPEIPIEVSDLAGHVLHFKLVGPRKNKLWQLTGKCGYQQHSGRRAGFRSAGHSPKLGDEPFA